MARLRDSIWSRTLPATSRETLLASDPMPETADVVLVGAGLVGLCTALSLRRRGVRSLTLVDRTSICGESTGASGGGFGRLTNAWHFPHPRLPCEPETFTRGYVANSAAISCGAACSR